MTTSPRPCHSSIELRYVYDESSGGIQRRDNKAPAHNIDPPCRLHIYMATNTADPFKDGREPIFVVEKFFDLYSAVDMRILLSHFDSRIFSL